MFIPFHDKVLSQFEGYEQLSEFDWAFYKEKYSKAERLDRILKAENKDPNAFQIAKQPDTLMLFYLLGDKEVKRLVTKLGYQCPKELITRTIQYYLARTSHGSTLSKITCASILFNKESEAAINLYREALVSDINDTQGGTTQEGIHLGVMVSTVSFVLKDMAGISIKDGLLAINPRIPSWVSRLKFKVLFKQNLYEIMIHGNECYVALCEKNNPDSCVSIQNKLVYLSLNKPQYFSRNKLKDKKENESIISA